MLLLTSTLAALLLGLLAAQNLDVPTFNVDSALAIASSATVAANAVASSATEDTVPSATSAALAVASSATQSANSVASAATQRSASTAASSTTPTSGPTTKSSLTTSTASGKTTTSSGPSSPSSKSASSSLASSVAAASSKSSASTSAAVSSALSSSSKIGIGLGVPLGVALASAVAGFLIYRHKKYKRSSRLGHHANIRGGDPYPHGDEENKETTVGSWDQGTYDASPTHSVPRDSGSSDLDGVVGTMPEVHGEHIPPYSTELGGTGGVHRCELAT